MTKRSIVFIAFVFALPGFATMAFGQKKGRELGDSLLTELNKEGKGDTDKVKILNAISFVFRLINPDTGIKFGTEGLRLARSAGWKKGQAMCYNNLSINQRLKSKYPLALDDGFAALKIYEELGYMPGVALANSNIGLVYSYQVQYGDALAYLNRSLDIYRQINDMKGVAGKYGDISIVYWRQKKYDSAISSAFQSLIVYDRLGQQDEVARTYGNIGIIYEDMGNYSKSLEYNFKSLEKLRYGISKREIGIRYSSIGQAYLSAAKHAEILKADQFIPPGKDAMLRKALTYLDSGLIVGNAEGDQYLSLESNKSYAEASELMGDYRSAYNYYRQYITLRDSVFSIENKVKIAQAEAHHELELTQLDLAKKNSEKWFLIASIMLLGIIGILFINRQHLKQKKLIAELGLAATELDSFRKNITDKNEIIERVNQEIERIKGGEGMETDSDVLTQLQHSIILTDEQWDNFRVLFEKVHRNFFVNLKMKMPDLTQAEIRLLALTKLKLSSKEMASMMGISPNTVRIYKHRLRRKLELGKEELIEGLVDDI